MGGGTNRRRRPSRFRFLLVGTVALVAAACSSTPSTSPIAASPQGSTAPPPTRSIDASGTSAAPGNPSDPDTGGGTSTTAPGRPSAGNLASRLASGGVTVTASGDFYAPPEPLPPGKPGDVIRVRPLTIDGFDDTDNFLVMYHSRTRDERDVAVTGVIMVPRTAIAPDQSRRVVSFTHGTWGMASPCAPSRNPKGPEGSKREFVDKGYVFVATDYVNLGPPGQRHPYLSGVAEGRSAIDIVRAARNIPLTHAGPDWVVFGHSQGGHAALFTGELAPEYAPELHLVGTVAAAPGSSLPYLSALRISDFRGYVVMALYGLAVDYPQLHPDDYFTDQARALTSVLDTGCVDDIINTYRDQTDAETLLKVDPNVTEPAKTILLENDPGHRVTPVPILIVHGTADAEVPEKASEAMFLTQCKIGQVVMRLTYDGADHEGVLKASANDVFPWIDARFNDERPPSNCAK